MIYLLSNDLLLQSTTHSHITVVEGRIIVVNQISTLLYCRTRTFHDVLYTVTKTTLHEINYEKRERVQLESSPSRGA